MDPRIQMVVGLAKANLQNVKDIFWIVLGIHQRKSIFAWKDSAQAKILIFYYDIIGGHKN